MELKIKSKKCINGNVIRDTSVFYEVEHALRYYANLVNCDECLSCSIEFVRNA